MRRLCRRPSLFGLLASLALASAAAAADKINVLIIDGQSNHNWKAMTPPMTADLVKSGRFTVAVATTPERKSAKEAWNTFHPDFSRCDVVLSNYNGEPWPDAVQ
jgi:hypothetical protein